MHHRARLEAGLIGSKKIFDFDKVQVCLQPFSVFNIFTLQIFNQPSHGQAVKLCFFFLKYPTLHFVKGFSVHIFFHLQQHFFIVAFICLSYGLGALHCIAKICPKLHCSGLSENSKSSSLQQTLKSTEYWQTDNAYSMKQRHCINKEIDALGTP